MDEFEKIRQLSEGLTNRKEPTFASFTQQQKRPEAQSGAMTNAGQQWNVGNNQQAYSASNRAESSYNQTQNYASQGNVNNFQNPNAINESINSNADIKNESHIYDFSKPLDGGAEGMDPNGIEEKSFSSLRVHLIALSLFVTVLLIVVIGFFVFNAEKDEYGEIVTITAPDTIVKELPEQEGGMVIPDQDKLVYNRMRENETVEKVESLFPEPEKPVLPTILEIEKNAPENEFVEVKQTEAINPLDAKVAENSKSIPVVAKPSENLVEQPIEKEVEKQMVVDENKPKKEIIPLKPLNAKKEEVKKPTFDTAKEIWKVQLFASNNKLAVENAWKRIQNKHSHLLSNMSYKIKKVEIPKRGNFYRLQVGKFPTRSMAEGLCTKLRARKQDCIPTK